MRNKKNRIKVKIINDYPIVSVVTVVHNAEKLLDTTIKSVVTQDYPAVEYLVIDGNSTDGTYDIIIKHEKSINYWVSEPDHGIYDAMNKAVDKASGEWIIYMNAGDTFVNNSTISNFVRDVEKETGLYCGAINFVNEETGESRYRKPHGLEKVWETVPCWHQGTFINMSVMRKYRYTTEYVIAGDHELFLRCYVNGEKFQFTNNIIANMISGGLHQQQIVRAGVESMKIVADYAPEIDMVYGTVYYKNLRFFNNIKMIKQQYSNIALYGYGAIGKATRALLEGHVVVIFDQNVKLHDETAKIPITYVDKIEQYSFDAILITVLGQKEAIASMLVDQYGIDTSKIIQLEMVSKP